MKKLKLLLAVFFFATTHLVAQEFAPIGAKWYFPETYFFSPNIGLVTFTSIGDTIINDKPARIVYKDNGTCNGLLGNYYFHESNDSIFRFDDNNQTFELLFITSAEVGDRWVINEPINPWVDSVKCIVDSISFYPISSTDSVRVQYVRLESFDDFQYNNGDTIFQSTQEIIIERIGFATCYFSNA